MARNETGHFDPNDVEVTSTPDGEGMKRSHGAIGVATEEVDPKESDWSRVIRTDVNVPFVSGSDGSPATVNVRGDSTEYTQLQFSDPGGGWTWGDAGLNITVWVSPTGTETDPAASTEGNPMSLVTLQAAQDNDLIDSGTVVGFKGGTYTDTTTKDGSAQLAQLYPADGVTYVNAPSETVILQNTTASYANIAIVAGSSINPETCVVRSHPDGGAFQLSNSGFGDNINCRYGGGTNYGHKIIGVDVLQNQSATSAADVFSTTGTTVISMEIIGGTVDNVFNIGDPGAGNSQLATTHGDDNKLKLTGVTVTDVTGVLGSTDAGFVELDSCTITGVYGNLFSAPGVVGQSNVVRDCNIVVGAGGTGQMFNIGSGNGATYDIYNTTIEISSGAGLTNSTMAGTGYFHFHDGCDLIWENTHRINMTSSACSFIFDDSTLRLGGGARYIRTQTNNPLIQFRRSTIDQSGYAGSSGEIIEIFGSEPAAGSGFYSCEFVDYYCQQGVFGFESTALSSPSDLHIDQCTFKVFNNTSKIVGGPTVSVNNVVDLNNCYFEGMTDLVTSGFGVTATNCAYLNVTNKNLASDTAPVPLSVIGDADFQNYASNDFRLATNGGSLYGAGAAPPTTANDRNNTAFSTGAPNIGAYAGSVT